MLTDTRRVMVAVYDDVSRATLVERLQNDGYETVAASCIGQARALLVGRLDALIVDLEADTTQLVDVIREGCHVAVDAWLPILAGSASEDLFLPVRLLERGADDVVEPWLYFEVRARLAALLRRADATRSRQVLRAGALRVDVTARQAWIGESEIELPNREFDLLRVLASEPDRVFTREELLASVWGLGAWARTRTLDTHAVRLRHRLNDAGGSWVRNVWGVGYRLMDGEFHPMQLRTLRGAAA